LEQVIKRTLLAGRPGAVVEDLFGNLALIAIALAVGGVLILYSGLKSSRAGAEAPAGTLTNASALWIGAAQGLVLPFRGLSRSGSTISTGLILGVPRTLAEEFSFALAVVITPPAILRELLRVLKARASQPGVVHLGPLIGPGLVGMAFSMIAGLLALKWLSGWIERGRWHYFGIYCLVAAAGVLALRAAGY
jgi:undecaprenyl-diphosphatase